MSRRVFAAGALALSATSGVAMAQTRTYRIALANIGTPIEAMTENGNSRYRAFFREMRRLGYTEASNLVVSRWSAVGMPDSRLDAWAVQIIATRPDIIVATGSRVALAFKRATTSVPIVMANVGDPIAWGLVERLNRPGGNVTGFASEAGAEEIGKRLQFLMEMDPSVTAVGYLGTPQTWAGTARDALTDAAVRAGLPVIPALVEAPFDDTAIQKSLAGLQSSGRVGVILAAGADILAARHTIASAAIELGLPTIGLQSEFSVAGCLMSYGANPDDHYARSAGYVDRILRGANPGDLPVQLPTKFDFVINMRTAKALRIAAPESLMVFATEVIE